MMKPVIFLSRSEDRSTSFIQSVSPVAQKVICKSFIRFEAIEINYIPTSDWLFFYSQKGAEYFHKAVTDLRIPVNQKIASFGDQTAHFLSKLRYSVDFVGTGEGKSTAEQFEEEVQGEKVLIIKGAVSRDSLSIHWTDKSTIEDLVVYKNTPISMVMDQKPDILCFTSPMNLTAYLSHNPITEDQIIICIGTSTAAVGLELGISRIYISKHPSMAGLAEMANSLCSV